MSEIQKEHEMYMDKAIKLARKAYESGDVPIGCVIVKDDKIIARGYNKRNLKKTTLAHAELLAIEQASRKIGDWRLEECTMYVTLEPCQMCSGAIVQARIPRVVIGCMNKKAGCAGSVINLLDMPQFNHQVEVITGVREQECSTMMSSFFSELRKGLIKTSGNSRKS
jgi:tRNA(adenine34) deaminase